MTTTTGRCGRHSQHLLVARLDKIDGGCLGGVLLLLAFDELFSDRGEQSVDTLGQLVAVGRHLHELGVYACGYEIVLVDVLLLVGTLERHVLDVGRHEVEIARYVAHNGDYLVAGEARLAAHRYQTHRLPVARMKATYLVLDVLALERVQHAHAPQLLVAHGQQALQRDIARLEDRYQVRLLQSAQERRNVVAVTTTLRCAPILAALAGNVTVACGVGIVIVIAAAVGVTVYGEQIAQVFVYLFFLRAIDCTA